ncbi:type IV toxin-antitoxin system AbiEi family antitoxin domain-containing protein, partial [Klebsiella pneumoniae]
MYLIEEALTSWLLNEYKKPVITKEEISLQIYIFYLKKEYNGEKIYQIRKNKAGSNEFENNISKLLRSGVLSRVEDNDNYHVYPHLIGGFYEVFFVKGSDGAPENDIVCSTYPYGYLSYLSAMDWHNI